MTNQGPAAPAAADPAAVKLTVELDAASYAMLETLQEFDEDDLAATASTILYFAIRRTYDEVQARYDNEAKRQRHS